MSDCGNCGCSAGLTAKNQEERRVLWILLIINAIMFVVELITGIWADSTGLIADSLDMLADALVYGVALYAVGRAAIHKTHAALASGIVQMAIALGVVLEVMRRMWWGSDPESWLMVSVGLVALVANTICLALIAKHRNEEVHMRASFIFSANDVIVNLSVVVAGGLVYALGNSWPDLVIGLTVAALVFWGGIRIVSEAKREALVTKVAV